MTARAGTLQSYRIRHPPVPRTTPRRRHPGGCGPNPQDCAPPPGARPRRGSRHPAPGPGSSPDGSRLCRRFEISVPVAASSYWELQIEQRHQKHSSCQRPSCFRSSCQRAPQGITKFGNGAAGRELIRAPGDALPASASGPTAAEVWQRNQPARWGSRHDQGLKGHLIYAIKRWWRALPIFRLQTNAQHPAGNAPAML